jgi:hypothetical protein
MTDLLAASLCPLRYRHGIVTSLLLRCPTPEPGTRSTGFAGKTGALFGVRKVHIHDAAHSPAQFKQYFQLGFAAVPLRVRKSKATDEQPRKAGGTHSSTSASHQPHHLRRFHDLCAMLSLAGAVVATLHLRRELALEPGPDQRSDVGRLSSSSIEPAHLL